MIRGYACPRACAASLVDNDGLWYVSSVMTLPARLFLSIARTLAVILSDRNRTREYTLQR